MADHDPYPMRSEEARRLAASVRGGDDDDDDDDECTGTDAKADAATTVVVVDNVGPSWHRMGTSLAQRLPKFFKGGRGRESSGGSNVGGESLLVGVGVRILRFSVKFHCLLLTLRLVSHLLIGRMIHK